MNFRRQHRDRIDLSMTPMIDVVFLLLIFFMVTTTFQREATLKIELPEAKGEKTSESKNLEIVIDSQGHYYIERHELVNTRIETLKKAISKALKAGARPVVVISADKLSPHQSVIRVLDAARQLGISHISFATQEEKDSE